MDIFSLADLLGSAVNNVAIRELNISLNNFDIKKASVVATNTPQDQMKCKRVKRQISAFMMSNKSLSHLLLNDCNLDLASCQFFVRMLSMRPNIINVHSDRNKQPFDSISLVNKLYYNSIMQK